MMTHWTTTAHKQTASHIASSISFWWNIRPQLAMVGKPSMVNINQCTTRCHHCPTRSRLMNICSIAAMRAVVVIRRVRRVNRFRWVTCTISNLKIKIMPYHEYASKSQLSAPKYPQNHKNGQSYGTKVCKAHLQHDDHLAFEGLGRV